MLVPRVEGRFITACTWSTSKWPALAASGMVLLRASAGRDGDTWAMEHGRRRGRPADARGAVSEAWA